MFQQKRFKKCSEINAFDFTEGDVVKPTHASGMVEFVKEHQIDKDKIAGWLTYSHYETSREASYRYLNRKLSSKDVSLID